MCIGYCFPFNLKTQELIIIVIFFSLFLISCWQEKNKGNWRRYFVNVIKKRKEREGIDKLFYVIQRALNYFFRGFIIRQILNPYFLFPFLIAFYFFLKVNDWNNGEIALIMTLIAILWYSKETFILREKQQNANEIARKSLMPGLTMRWQREEDSYPSYRLILSNQGKGCALRPRLEIIGRLAREYRLDLYGANAIYPGDCTPVGLSKGAKKISSGHFRFFLDTSKVISDPIPVKIMFDSTESKKERKESTLYTKIEIDNPEKTVKIKGIKWG